MQQNGVTETMSAEALKTWLIGWLAAEQGMEPSAVDPSQAFLSYGLDSVQAMSLVGDLETKLSRRLPPTLAWDYPNINALTDHLMERLGGEAAKTPAPKAAETSRAEVEGLLAGLDQISDKDVDSLLTQYLGKS